MLLPALARAKQKAQAIQCVNNTKQFLVAWTMYADENSDRLVSNASAGGAADNWVSGYMANGNGTLRYPDCTNIALITNYKLWPYVKSLGLYKCPANQRGMVRGISMNCHMGDAGDSGYVKMAQIVRPANRFVMTDEDQNSINDGWFLVTPVNPAAPSFTLLDWPGTSHGGSGALSFADGHTDLHRWKQFGIAPVPYDPAAGKWFSLAKVLFDAAYLMKASRHSPEGWWQE